MNAEQEQRALARITNGNDLEQASSAPAVYAAINAVQRDLVLAGGIGKSQTNTYDNYQFRGIDDVYNALGPLLAKNQLVIVPRMLERSVVERVSRDNKALFYVTVAAEFDFIAVADGSKHTARTFGEAMDRGDKATNKAMSAAYKYACFQTFTIPLDTDEGDRDSVSGGGVRPVKPIAEGGKVRAPANKSVALEIAADLSVEEIAGLHIMAQSLVDLATEEKDEKVDRAAAMWRLVGPIDGSEKVVVLWDILREHTALRRRIKEIGQAVRAAQGQLTAPPDDPDNPATGVEVTETVGQGRDLTSKELRARKAAESKPAKRARSRRNGPAQGELT